MFIMLSKYLSSPCNIMRYYFTPRKSARPPCWY